MCVCAAAAARACIVRDCARQALRALRVCRAFFRAIRRVCVRIQVSGARGLCKTQFLRRRRAARIARVPRVGASCVCVCVCVCTRATQRIWYALLHGRTSAALVEKEFEFWVTHFPSKHWPDVFNSVNQMATPLFVVTKLNNIVRIFC